MHMYDLALEILIILLIIKIVLDAVNIFYRKQTINKIEDISKDFLDNERRYEKYKIYIKDKDYKK